MSQPFDETEAGPELSSLFAYQRIQDWLAVQRFDLAERELREMLRNDPQNSHAHLLLGWTLNMSGRATEAESEARAAVQHDPENADALSLLGELAMKRGENRQAEALLLDALKIEPNNPQLLHRYAVLMLRTGHFDKAERLLRLALQQSPDEPNLHSTLSLVLGEKKKGVSANRHASHSVGLAPVNDYSHSALGASLLRTGRPFAARRHLREALRLDPSDTNVEHAYLMADRACRWLYLPMYYLNLIVDRIPGKQFGLWGGVVVVMSMLPRFGVPGELINELWLGWLILCVYTWVISPLTSLWIKLFPPR